MNIQAMMKQAQKLQQDMMKVKNEIEQQIFTGKHSMITVEVNGKKELTKVNIDKNMEIKTAEDIEMLEDMLVLAINDALKKVDLEIKNKMGKFGSGLAGLL